MKKTCRETNKTFEVEMKNKTLQCNTPLTCDKSTSRADIFDSIKFAILVLFLLNPYIWPKFRRIVLGQPSKNCKKKKWLLPILPRMARHPPWPATRFSKFFHAFYGEMRSFSILLTLLAQKKTLVARSFFFGRHSLDCPWARN